MSNGSAPGLSAGDVRSIVQSEISGLHREIQELNGRVNWLEQYIDREIRRLEEQMQNLAAAIERAIDSQTNAIVDALGSQTAAVVGGVAATTLMIERTKSQIETDFQHTRHRLELQTESTLQIEIGKKISDVSALSSKLSAFAQDVRTRYDKSLEAVAINRDLYDVNFKKILDEYENKIRTIGDHIIRIREEDIAPAEVAARVPYEAAHSLPMELDLERLDLRSQSLDQTLALLKSTRLDDVLGALDGVHQVLEAHSMGDEVPGKGVELRVEGLLVHSSIQTQLVAGCEAQANAATGHPTLRVADPSLAPYSSAAVAKQFKRQLDAKKQRPAAGAELVALSKAAQALRQRGLISDESHTLLEDFLGAGKLMVVEA
jgi:hypothetical protein